jgi:hypothetical protein
MSRTVREIPDEELLRRAVTSCRANANKGHKHPRWVATMETFQLGSAFAWQLCERFDLDPDEIVERPRAAR